MKLNIGLVMMLLGLAGALAAFVLLMVLGFKWIDLVFYVPGLGLCAALLFIGRARVKKQ
jgi:hypothetical protein